MNKPYSFPINIATVLRVSVLLIALGSTTYSAALVRETNNRSVAPERQTTYDLSASPNSLVTTAAAGSQDLAQLAPNRLATSAAGRTPAADAPEAEGDWTDFLTSTGFLVTMAIGLISLLFLRRRRSQASVPVVESRTDDFGFSDFDSIKPAEKAEAASGLTKASAGQSSNSSATQRKSVGRLPLMMYPSSFGAFQVDQEVGKLIVGQSHKMEILASREPSDQRAVEASLLKALTSRDDEERRRIRGALEDYGFVARQNAAVLLATDAYERSSAAKVLGQIKSSSALPFLLEALYDNDTIVRNQAVLSVGELGLPSAIGPLLDIARKHNDVPNSLLSRALSACSVEGLNFFDDVIPETHKPVTTDLEMFCYEVRKLAPASVVQDLPETSAEVEFIAALAKLEAAETAERAEGIIRLAHFAVQQSVTALARVVRRDSRPNLRALAIASLATINHESVFPSVLIGMADESREVRASAARSLTRLSFNRADAYIRVMETDDLVTLREVAQACVKAGVASQAIDRLGSTDRRQAYEAFSLVSLLAKADVLEPIVAAIRNHASVDVRLGAVRLLGTIDDPVVLQELREIVHEPMPQSVKMALVETIAQLGEAMSEAGKGTTLDGASHPKELNVPKGFQKQTDTDSAELLRKQRDEDDADFLSRLGGLEAIDCDFDQDELSAAEILFGQSAEGGSVFEDDDHRAEPRRSQNMGSGPLEPYLSCLERVSEPPRIDTGRLPALPLG